MKDQLTVVNELHILGKQNVGGYQFTGIAGGFGEGKKAMLVKEIAAIHGKQVGHINEAINNNRNHFKDGIDIVDLKNTGFVIGLVDNGIYTQNAINKSSSVYLLSERGYAKLLKILEDDTAWELYDQFVDGYFNMREQKQLPNDPMSILKLTFDALEGQKQEIQGIKSDVKDLKNNAPLYAVECDEVSHAVRRLGVKLLGGKDSPAYKDKSLSKKLYSDIYGQLYREYGVTSYKAIKRHQLEEAKAVINEKYTIPKVLKDEIEEVNTNIQIRMEEV
ncbi:ORF6C domain-containing protein [Bacillus mycoides]|uniref:ORF6C domain-containing protein n=2 Tax=Bacillus mycoides TaxID=1405 RepID=UPI003D64E745